MEWKLSKQEKRRLEKRSPFYATFDYKFSHRRWWHFMLLLLLKILMLWHKVTAPTKKTSPPSWEKWDGSWKIEYNFYRNSLMCAVILYKLCPLGNMLDVAFKLNWNCPPSQSNVIVTHLLNKLCSQLCALLCVLEEEGGIKRSMRDWHTKEA